MTDLMQREMLRSTASLITSEGVWITLFRKPPHTSDGAGGQVRSSGTPNMLSPQRVFKAGQDRVVMPTGTEEGEFRGHEFVLVGMPSNTHGLIQFDVQVGDTFQWNSDTYTVHSIHHDRTYQIKALCRVVGS